MVLILFCREKEQNNKCQNTVRTVSVVRYSSTEKRLVFSKKTHNAKYLDQKKLPSYWYITLTQYAVQYVFVRIKKYHQKQKKN